MISATTDERALLSQSHVHTYLILSTNVSGLGSVTVGPATIDTGADYQLDRLVAGSVLASMDEAFLRGSVSFFRGEGATSLSPYVGASTYNGGDRPLIDLGRQFGFWVAVVDPGTTPSYPADFHLVFNGYVSSINAGDRAFVTCELQQSGAAWPAMLTWIKTQSAYGPDTLEGVLNSLLADHNPVPTTVTMHGDPDWTVAQYWQEEMPLLDAMRRVVLQRGWDIRCFPSTGEVFQVYEPDREGATPVATLGPNEYSAVTDFSVNWNDIRNVVEVWFNPIASTRDRVSVSDAESIAHYGERWMRLNEDRTSNIDTEDEANILAAAALADLKDPFATFAITTQTRPWWPVELNDVHALSANDDHTDAETIWTVASYRHEFAKGSGSTTIAYRGKPIAANRAYRLFQPRTTHISLDAPPPDAQPAKEGAFWVQVDDLTFPA